MSRATTLSPRRCGIRPSVRLLSGGPSPGSRWRIPPAGRIALPHGSRVPVDNPGGSGQSVGMTYTVSQRTRRRFVLGCQGLWPGRRATGLAGARQTLRRIEAVQVDPLNVAGRSHDLVLHARVADYRPEHLDALLYKKREFFDYGGCVRIRPMDELPYVRASMGWVHTDKRWAPFAIEHKALIAQVLQRLRDDGPLSARDFPGESKGGSFRSSKDGSRALYYLWL